MKSKKTILRDRRKRLDLIRMKGHLEIDNRVKSGLDWSDVVADTINVIPGKIIPLSSSPQSPKMGKVRINSKECRRIF